MKIYDASRLPPSITLGWDGENNWRPIAFDCSALLTGNPDAVVTLWLLPKGEAQAFPVALERDGNTVTWTPLNEEMTAEHGQLQIVVQDGTDVGKSKVIDYTVRDSLVGGADHPAETPSWAVQVVADVTEQADRAEEAAESIGESIGEQLPGAIADYLEEHPVTVTETDPTVPSWAKQPNKPTYTAAEVGAMPDSYTPPVTSVNGKAGAVNLSASDVGAYTKPASGIPASDLAAGVIPDISGKQDAPLIGQAYDSTEPDYLTPYEVVTALEAGKDVIVEWHDNDFGTLYFTAWNTAHLGNITSAVSNTAVKYNGTLVLYQLAGNVASAGWYAVPSSVAQISDLPTVPTNVSAFTNDAGYLTQHQDISGKANKIPRVVKTAQDDTVTLQPNVEYVFPEMANLAVTLAAPTDLAILNEYHFFFTSGATPTVFSLSGILNGDELPDNLDADKLYEVSVLEGLALITPHTLDAEEETP